MRSRAVACEATRRCAYWERQLETIHPHVEPEGFEVRGGSVAVDVHQVVRDADGTVLADGRVRHVYTIRDGLIARMEIAASEPRAS